MRTRVLCAVGILLLAAGCATSQKSVALAKGTIGPDRGRVGVVMTKVPKPDTQFPGAACLLCYAAASVANQSLTNYAGTLSTADLTVVQDDIAARLRARNAEVVIIATPLDLDTLPTFRGTGTNQPNKDFSDLRRQYRIDRLVVIRIAAIGFSRNYASYIPTSDPSGFIDGAGSMVDLATNSYEWYMPFHIVKGSEGPWDEPPKFPNLTNAYFQVIEMGKDRFAEAWAE